MSKEAEIKFLIKLDDKGVPGDIYWSASESGIEGYVPCDSLMISVWDRSEKNTMSVDLWTNRMQVGEMNAHFYFSLMKMADTYGRATGNQELSAMIRDFAGEFAKKLEEFTVKDG
ncbi:MAG TPA: gliding motility protein GldC [Thermodesulfobacteriota bacterium]|nr:gliding motility protein GldC [Thermodesulfobacteriota bacterium]